MINPQKSTLELDKFYSQTLISRLEIQDFPKLLLKDVTARPNTVLQRKKKKKNIGKKHLRRNHYPCSQHTNIMGAEQQKFSGYSVSRPGEIKYWSLKWIKKYMFRHQDCLQQKTKDYTDHASSTRVLSPSVLSLWNTENEDVIWFSKKNGKWDQTSDATDSGPAWLRTLVRGQHAAGGTKALQCLSSCKSMIIADSTENNHQTL